MKWIEKLLLPVAIVLVGTIGSIIIKNSQIKSASIISNSQIKSAEKIATAQIRCQDINVKSEHEIKVLEIFFSEITQGDPKNRQYAFKLIGSIKPGLAQKLLEAVRNDEFQESEIHDVALRRLEQMDEIKEEQYYQSDSIRKEDMDYLTKVADTQFKAEEFEEALDNYYEVLEISPEDENAYRKIKDIQDQKKIKPNLKKTKPKKD